MQNKTLKTAITLLLFFVGGSTQAGNLIPVHEFQSSMIQLWQDHVSWTRSYLVSTTNDLEDKSAVLNRLLKNQTDIGDAIKPFYGDEAGIKLSSLLTDHIYIASDLIGYLMEDKSVEAAAAMQAWRSNANEIAVFLNTANPTNWPLADLQAMLNEHLDSTSEEVAAQIAGDWDASVAAYDKVSDHAFLMANTLSSGIIKQFPEKFEHKCECAK